jgi:hypothetical protein
MENVHRIPLKNTDRTAIVDLADRDLVAGFIWHLSSGGYVYADRGRMRIALHRLIAGPGDGDRVDHENGDPLDNRTCNLRVCNPAQNRANAGPNRLRSGRTSRYKGVSWNKDRRKWVAYIHVDGKSRQLGRYDEEAAAARAYDRAAKETWGEFARLNNV